MQNAAFDRIARGWAARRSRRAVLAGAAAATSTALLPTPPASTQPASPVATPATPAGGVPLLFVQVFAGGAFTPKAGEDGLFVLTLTGGLGPTVAFSDRPARVSEVIETERLPDVLSFAADNPPNAALVAQIDGFEIVLVVELTAPGYDPATRTATYEARPLPDAGRFAAAFGDRAAAAGAMPVAFGPASLFIDSGAACVAFGQACDMGGTPCCSEAGRAYPISCLQVTCSAPDAQVSYTANACLY